MPSQRFKASIACLCPSVCAAAAVAADVCANVAYAQLGLRCLR